MDGDKKKRKREDDDDEENEEDKMEKFFALIKSTRELRERIVAGKEKTTGDKPQPAAEPWNPTFRLEDFVDVPPPQIAAETGPSTTVRKKQESDEGNGNKELDLNLSL
ncbi:hypothetical protein ABFS83_02G088000 [Erythranthe nasuta]